MNERNVGREVDGDCAMESGEVHGLGLAEVGARFGAGVEHDAVDCGVFVECSFHTEVSLLEVRRWNEVSYALMKAGISSSFAMSKAIAEALSLPC